LCGEDTFGIERYKSTGRRKFESTTSLQAKLLSGYCKQDPERIHQIEVPNMNNTAQQIREVARLQRSEERSKGKNIKYLVVTWGFHEDRVRSHMEGYGLKGQLITVEEILRYFKLSPNFNLDTLLKALPMSSFEDRERLPRLIARYDKLGIVPILMTWIRGASVTDIEHTKDNGVQFLDTTGKKRLQSIRRKKALGR
jgi:hypothetical protein